MRSNTVVSFYSLRHVSDRTACMINWFPAEMPNKVPCSTSKIYDTISLIEKKEKRKVCQLPWPANKTVFRDGKKTVSKNEWPKFDSTLMIGHLISKLVQLYFQLSVWNPCLRRNWYNVRVSNVSLTAWISALWGVPKNNLGLAFTPRRCGAWKWIAYFWKSVGANSISRTWKTINVQDQKCTLPRY